MKKKTLSKISAILCLTTLFTSSLGQLASAYKECNKKHLHFVEKFLPMPTPFELETAKNEGKLPELLSKIYRFGKTFLMLAIEQKNPEFVEKILKYAKEAKLLNFVLTAKDFEGNNVLHHGLKNSQSFDIIIKYAKEANILDSLILDDKNIKGQTILMTAVQSDSKDSKYAIDVILSKSFLENLFKIYQKNEFKRFEAFCAQNLLGIPGGFGIITFSDTVYRLLNSTDNNGNNPLMCAVIKNQPENVKTLLNAHEQFKVSIKPDCISKIVEQTKKDKNFNILKILVVNVNLSNKNEILKRIENKDETIFDYILNLIK